MDMLGILGGPQGDPKTAPKWIKKFFSREKMKKMEQNLSAISIFILVAQQKHKNRCVCPYEDIGSSFGFKGGPKTTPRSKNLGFSEGINLPKHTRIVLTAIL